MARPRRWRRDRRSRPKHREPSKRKVHWGDGKKPDNPLFSPAVSYGDLLFIAGKGAHFAGDISAHTKHVLDTIES